MKRPPNGYYTLLLPALVIHARLVKNKDQLSAQMLPAKSVIYIGDPKFTRWNSLDIGSDLLVRYADHTGGEHFGYLAGNASLKAGGQATAFGDGDRDPIGPWDDLREQLAQRHWTMGYFCSRMKESEVPLVRAVIRELGGAAPKASDKDTLTTVLLRVTGSQGGMMSADAQDATATQAKASKKGKKGKAKGKEKKAKGEGRSAAKSCGEALIGTGTGNGKIKAIAARLQKGEELSGKELVGLRDLVKEAAAKAREDGKEGIAAKLSSANRLVRRLARAAA